MPIKDYLNSKRLLLFSIFIALILGFYQNCADVKFSRVQEEPLPNKVDLSSINPVEPEQSNVPEVIVDPNPTIPEVIVTTTTTLPTLVTTTTTLPSPVTTTTTTTTLPIVVNKNFNFSGTINSDLNLPLIEFKFVIDNSLSMKSNNTSIADAVGVMFESPVGQSNLNNFNVSGEVYTTTQNVIPIGTYLVSVGIGELISPDLGRFAIVSQVNSSPTLDSSLINTALQRTDRPTTSVPGDILGYGIKVNSEIVNNYGNLALPTVIKLTEKEIYPMPVSKYVNNKIVSTSYSDTTNGINQYLNFITDIKSKINLVSNLTYDSNSNLRDDNWGYFTKPYVDEESGLCAIARIVKKQKNDLDTLAKNPTELKRYQENTPRNVFVLATDEDDDVASGSKCIDRIISRKASYYSCGYNTSELKFSYDQQNSNLCTSATNFPNLFVADIHITGVNTVANYKIFTNTTKTVTVCESPNTEISLEGGTKVCRGTDPNDLSSKYQSKTTTTRIESDGPPIGLSGDKTNNCNPQAFGLGNNYVENSIVCTIDTIDKTVGENIFFAQAMSPSVNTLSSVQTRSGLSIAEINSIFKDKPSSLACSISLKDYAKNLLSPNVFRGSLNYNLATFDKTQYSFKECNISNKNTTYRNLATNPVVVTNQLECTSKFDSSCSSYGISNDYCRDPITNSNTYTAGTKITQTGIRYFSRKGVSLPLSSYTERTLCSQAVSSDDLNANNTALALCATMSGTPNATILDYLKKISGETSNPTQFSNTHIIPNSVLSTLSSQYIYFYNVISDSVWNNPICDAGNYDFVDVKKDGFRLSSGEDTYFDYVSGTVNSIGSPISFDPTLVSFDKNSKPAVNLKQYILNTISELKTKYNYKIPIIKALVKQTQTEAMTANRQKVGAQYIDFIKNYNILFPNYAQTDELIESADSNTLQTYYKNTFNGLTDSIKNTVSQAIPFLDANGSPLNLLANDIANVQGFCIYKTVNGVEVCETVSNVNYVLKDMLYNNIMVVHLVVKSDAAISLKKGTRFYLQYQVK